MSLALTLLFYIYCWVNVSHQCKTTMNSITIHVLFVLSTFQSFLSLTFIWPAFAIFESLSLFNLCLTLALQIKQEMAGCLDFLKHVYSVFGFTFQLKLSTRPEKFLGEVEVWDKAEKVWNLSLSLSLSLSLTHTRSLSLSLSALLSSPISYSIFSFIHSP